MSSPLVDLDKEILPLPQCGYGVDVDFDTLIKANRFIFRVYTPKERSPFADDTEPFFVAPRFDELLTQSPVEIPKVKFFEPLIGTYGDVVRHLDWTTRMSSPYISTSFSFSWAIWEAVRRYHQGVKKDVEIAIIDAAALGGRAATAIQLLQKSLPTDRTEQYWKWYRFSHDSQSVLVYGMIPRTAVLASIPLLQILRKMPSYFLRTDIQSITGNPLDQVSWSYTSRKESYRHFCQEMTKLFLRRPDEVRLRDSTAGAVRFALGFLRPFFHVVVQEDFDAAIVYLRNLAVSISVWPGGQWVKDHPEIREIVETMVLALGEELREKYFIQTHNEINRLRLVIDELQGTINAHNKGESTFVIDNIQLDSDDEGDFDMEANLEESEDSTLVSTDIAKVLRKPPSLEMSDIVLPRISVTFQTPITPPDSPRNSVHLSSVTVPHVAVSSPISISFESILPETTLAGQKPEIPSNNALPLSKELSSLPPSLPSRSSDVWLSSLPEPVVEKFAIPDKVNDLELAQDPSMSQEDAITANVPRVLPDVLQSCQEKKQASASLSGGRYEAELEKTEKEPLYVTEEHSVEDIEYELHAKHGLYVPPSPSDSWVRVRPKLSSFSSVSSRSSITSVETLCDIPEFLPKGVSIVTGDSFEIAPPFSSFRSFGLASRTISFSEPEPSLKLPISSQLKINPLNVPLPPSPSTISESCSPLVPALSLSPSGTSSPKSSLLHSPSPSITSLSSSCPSTPRPVSPLELHPPEAGPNTIIIPPKRQISLLSSVSDSTGDADTTRPQSKRKGVRSVVLADATSYAVTGFLIGAFITLFLFSTQRKSLLVVT